jgi:SNF family Na+-dependent transporter
MVAAASAPHAHWSSRAAFVLAAIGSAVGLGNLWRFPAEAGANGGAAFVLVYILCVVLIGMPLLLSETIIGRHGQRNAVASTVALAHQSNASGGWAALAWFGMVAAFFVLTFYSVVAGWVLYFIGATALDWLGALAAGQPLAGAFADGTVEDVQGLMPALFADPLRMTAMHFIFAAITIFVVARGVNQGIEKAATWLMPAFFILLVIITIYAGFTGDFAAGFAFLFTPDFSRVLEPLVLNSALGQAFFSLSLGSAILITYGAYASRETNLAHTSGIVAAADTSVAIIAGLAIFPIVFAVGLDPAAGPTLLFQSLPSAFHAMPGGALVAMLFFILRRADFLGVSAGGDRRVAHRALQHPPRHGRPVAGGRLFLDRAVFGVRLQHLGRSSTLVVRARFRECQLVRRVRRRHRPHPAAARRPDHRYLHRLDRRQAAGRHRERVASGRPAPDLAIPGRLAVPDRRRSDPRLQPVPAVDRERLAAGRICGFGLPFLGLHIRLRPLRLPR